MSYDFSNWSCPLPLRDSPVIVMGHGSGGRLSDELITNLFVPAMTRHAGHNPLIAKGDSAVVEIGGVRLAMSTDSHVVAPRFFPGGNLGELAINGTVNDLAMMGARPEYLSAAFILEEGTAIAELGVLADAMGEAAAAAGVQVITGDTKVVESGHGDGVFISTAGIGIVAAGTDIRPDNARPGDKVIVSGPIAQHGVAVLSVRSGIEFDTVVESDTAPLADLVAAMIAVHPEAIHTLRDPTRGGVAATVNEIAASSNVGIALRERDIPVAPEVRAACGFLGLDPLTIANEGRLVAFVDPAHAEQVLAVMRERADGAGATIIGEVTADHPGVVTAKTGLGAERIVDLPLAEQLPRIC